MNEVENLRRMNITTNRTDVENLFLKEMVEEDTDDMFNEEAEFDALIPGDDSLFSDSSSEDSLDGLDPSEDDDIIDDELF